jgi:1,2-phenylacetyl-CoA epoxidase PaaB subunit
MMLEKKFEYFMKKDQAINHMHMYMVKALNNQQNLMTLAFT